ncbi:MAG: NAD-glutamate dehydrogenase [Pseudomonadota bacterium]|nr:NAD-glutamate dehydrogenase [Pseudomonadota bacterium]
MTREPAGHTRDEALARLDRMLEERLSAHLKGPVRQFASRYFRRVPDEDIRSISPEDLYGGVLAHWGLAWRRHAGAAAIRVYNPVHEENGWQSPHTVVEIVTDDMPFLVDSLSIVLIRHGLSIHLVIHPVVNTRRDRQDRIVDIPDDAVSGVDVVAEALIRFEVDQISETSERDTLRRELGGVLADVRTVVEDWPAMRERMQSAIREIESRMATLPTPRDELLEDLAFLRWIDDHHFTYIGYRCFDLLRRNRDFSVRLEPGSGLGIFRGKPSGETLTLPEKLRERALAPSLLILTKSINRSTVHRPAHLDYLGIKRFDDDGRVIGEWRFHGLYSSLAYDTHPGDVPLLRRKVGRVIERAALSPRSHAGKALEHILHTLPRDEMFQATEDELLGITSGILSIEERRQLRVFARRDAYGRFVSVLVYTPRERYNTELRLQMQQILMDALRGLSSEFNVQFSDSVLARVHFIIRTDPDNIPQFDLHEIESLMVESMLSWGDRLKIELQAIHGEAGGNRLYHFWGKAFPAAYLDDYTPRTAAADIHHLEDTRDGGRLAMHLYRPPEGDESLLRFKVFGQRRPLALSDALPILERMGLRVLRARPYELSIADGIGCWIINFDMSPARGADIDVMSVKGDFQETFAAVSREEMENDAFNALALTARLHPDDIILLRALCKYLLQTRVPFSQIYMEQALNGNPSVARGLVALFRRRFDPARQGDDEDPETLQKRIEAEIEGVASLDEDRILHCFLDVILAAVRTNAFQKDERGRMKPWLSFKVDASRMPELPLPLPRYEIFVYSPRLEGIHLRGGMVSRGGLRWSDRREDFRTEVLGLMKAQMVKNAVIVPVGAKGGFVVKRLPDDALREALRQEVETCYRSFIRGLLDLTDNLDSGKVVPPPGVVRHDGDDPYLVVAADKGTATFSDIANGIATEYGFWLGDAFASGGTNGYDHKKMGITARGAWVSVKRHFRELGVDIHDTPFTVAGIGDMSGDVFGNGILLSRQIKLVAAFDHRHVFLDPDPDPGRSFLERSRLFGLPRSAWSDYDPKLISPGGGVWPRNAKSIEISGQARAALGIDATRLAPNELIGAILKAPVDLLWNGGIGTWIKAAGESHAEVGDRANDNVRVDAPGLRCRVVGEGGNLGLTQRARIEFAAGGGMINTDAIDNSGGVDCSDREVNIKILLNKVVSNGDLTWKQRNELLVSMTEDIARLVLRDNYLQTQAISIAANAADYFLSDHMRLISVLEKEGRINRKIETLPEDDELTERHADDRGLTRPEIATVLAHSKIRLYDELLVSRVGEDPCLSTELRNYFPPVLQKRFADDIERHPLRREIIATCLTNDMLNRMGSTFGIRMQEETGGGAEDIARAYRAGREVFRLDEIWSAIEALDDKAATVTQRDMIGDTRRLLDRATRWLLLNRGQPLDISTAIGQFSGHITEVAGHLQGLLRGEALERMETRVTGLAEAGVPESLSRRVAGLGALFSALDISEATRATGAGLRFTAETWYELAGVLDIDWLNERARDLSRSNHWNRSARALLRDEIAVEHRAITAMLVYRPGSRVNAAPNVEAWLAENANAVSRYRSVLAELRGASRVDMAMISVALRQLRTLARHEATEGAGGTQSRT